MKISVIGLGKIGLPLAVQFASKGHTVFGVDVNPTTVQQVNEGIEPFPGETSLKELLSSATVHSPSLPPSPPSFPPSLLTAREKH